MQDQTRREFFGQSLRLLAAGTAGAGLAGFAACDSGLLIPSQVPFPLRPTDLQINLLEDGPVILDPATGTNYGSEIIFSPPKSVEVGDNLGLGFEFRFPTEISVPSEVDADIKINTPWFFIYAGRVDTHPLEPCVYTRVKHTHLIIKRQKSTDDNRAWSHLHLGAYKEGGRRCFVLYDSKNKRICFKTCTPTRRELERILLAALILVFAAAGIVVAFYVLSQAAAVLASALFATLLVL